MDRFLRSPGVVFAALVLAWPGLLPAADPAAETPAAGAKEPSLRDVLNRLGKVEKELLELRLKSGKIPADKQDQRILSLVETPYLGSVHYGSTTNQRFLALKLMLVNLTDQALVLKREDVQLTADGQTYAVKDPPQQFQYMGLQIGQQQVQLRTLRMPNEVSLPVGGTAATWVVFPELPPGNHVPQLVLKLKLGDATRDIDVNATQRDVLGLKVERLGPRGALAEVSIGGTLNTVNVGTLVEEIDRLAQDKVVRLVIRFAEGSAIVDPQLGNWLFGATLSSGRQQQFNEPPFPALPASLRELHLASVPTINETVGINAPYPAFNYGNPGAAGEGRVHKTEAEAVIAALRSAYEALPRDELLQAIQNGTRLERAAALTGGGGRLAVEQLPLLLKYADDNDPIVQQAALAALGHFGEAQAIDTLVSWAAKNVPDLSATAVASLAGSRFPAAHEALLKLLANEAPEGKKAIVRILAAYPRPIWSQIIYEFVRDPRSGLNVDALQALVQVGHPQMLSVLEDALRGKDPALSQAALAIIVGRNDQESEDLALEYTLGYLKTSPPTAVMLQLLGRVKDRRALPLMMGQFDKEQNKSTLIQTLGLLGDEDTAKFLFQKYPLLQGHEKGEVLRAMKQLDKARFRQLALQALQTGDGSVVGHAVQGLQEDGGPEAIQVMIDALDSSPANYSWSSLCNALAQNATAAARAALLKARESGSVEKRNYALNALQTIRQRSPGYQYVAEAQSFMQMKQWKEAAERLDFAIQLDPALSDAYSERGHCLLQLEKPADAVKDFAKAWELDPWNSLALTGLCLTQLMIDGKHAAAVTKLEESRSKFLRQPMFHYNAACVYGRAYERVEQDDPSAGREALLGQYRQAALADLKVALDGGLLESVALEHIKGDPDLKPFQESADFLELLDRSVERSERPRRGVRNRRQ